MNASILQSTNTPWSLLSTLAGHVIVSGALAYCSGLQVMAPPFAEWLPSCLANHTTRVRVKNMIEDSHIFEEAVPLGNVLSPMPFMTHIGSLLGCFEVSVYADDLALTCSYHKNEHTYQMQRRVARAWTLAISCLLQPRENSS